MLHLLNTVAYMYYAMSRDAVMNKAFLFLPTIQLLLHAETAFPLVERFALGLYWGGGANSTNRTSLVMPVLQMYCNARSFFQSSCVLLSSEAALVPEDTGLLSC